MRSKPKSIKTKEDSTNNQAIALAHKKLVEGFALHQKGQLAEAQELYRQVLLIQPKHFDAWYLLGVIAYKVKNFERAVELLDRAIALNPQHSDAYNYRGNTLNELKHYEAAVQSYDQAIALKPDFADAYNNRGVALQELRQIGAALQSYDKAISLKPDYAGAFNNRGNLLKEIKRYEAALQNYDKAISFKPDYAGAYNNRGNVLKELKLYEAALQSYDKAIAFNPGYAEAFNSRGIVHKELKQYEAALQNYDKAITLNPDYADAYNNRGNVFHDLKRYEAALQSYDKALALRPQCDFLFGLRFLISMQICDWSNATGQLKQLAEKIERGESASPPFAILGQSGSPSLQRKAAGIWVKNRYPLSHVLADISKRPKRNKIRIAYFSADFRNHATSFLTVGLFETHDRSRFELTAFSFGPDTQDDMRKRMEVIFDNFVDVRNKSDEEVALLARNLEIDIAIDLGGFTTDSRTGIFALRAAPLQINFLGYAGTMAAEYIDYLIADNTLIPATSQQYYSEKIVYLPNSYQINDAKRVIAEKVFSREELGLPDSGFVFCCFNNNYKITPDTFDGWMRILKQVEGSILWLFEDNPTAAINLRKEATRRGIRAERLVFAKRMALPEHLARHRAADLFIDTLPYNAHTTASDALWAGLPVLTCAGEAFASRVAASLLNAIRLPELITSTQEEFEARAVELATHPERLNVIKQKLEKNRLTTPLFDTPLFTRHIEAAFMEMMERYHADLPPEHIDVGRLV